MSQKASEGEAARLPDSELRHKEGVARSMSLDAPQRLRGDGAGKPELSLVFGPCKPNALNMKPD